MSVTEIQNNLHLHTILSSTPFVVADFFATWCAPCKAISPIFQQLAKANSIPDVLSFIKINVDEFPEVAGRNGVTAMPTFLVFRDGKKVEDASWSVRSADPRGLQRLIETVVTEAKKTDVSAKKEEKKKAAETKQEPETKVEEKTEQETVSGSYGMNRGTGWRMKP